MVMIVVAVLLFVLAMVPTPDFMKEKDPNQPIGFFYLPWRYYALMGLTTFTGVLLAYHVEHAQKMELMDDDEY